MQVFARFKCFDKCRYDERMKSLKKVIPFLALSYLFIANFAESEENQTRKETMKYALTPLEYPYDALEPYIDAETVKLHHSKHQQAYVNNLNNALASEPNFKFNGSVSDLIANLANVPMSIRTAVRNNGGGVANHEFYWQGLSPKKSHPSEELLSAIKEAFGSFENFQKIVNDSALSRFGSGWAWLGIACDGSLKVCSTPNQDSPMMSKEISGCSIVPILTIDVWEHAYYLNYQNRRADYLKAIWNIINWERVSKRYEDAVKSLKK